MCPSQHTGQGSFVMSDSLTYHCSCHLYRREEAKDRLGDELVLFLPSVVDFSCSAEPKSDSFFVAINMPSQGKSPDLTVTCTSPVNIAVIKYWGKRNEALILPINSSLSGTLNQADMKTTTTIFASTRFEKDRIWLNGRCDGLR